MIIKKKKKSKGFLKSGFKKEEQPSSATESLKEASVFEPEQLTLIEENSELQDLHVKDEKELLREERKQLVKDNLRIIEEREARIHPAVAEPSLRGKSPIEHMKDELDKQSQGWKDMEYKKFIRETEMLAHQKKERTAEESLLDRFSRCMAKKICLYLEKERTGQLSGFDICMKPDIARRDWEGQDNMQQFVKEAILKKEIIEEEELLPPS